MLPVIRLLTVCAMLGAAGCATTRPSVRNYIAHNEARLAETIVHGDTSVLREIFAEDCLWTLTDGTVWSKQQAIAAIDGNDAGFVSNRLETITVRLFGNVAVVQGRDAWHRRSENDRAEQGHFVWTDTWLLRDGRWQIIQVQDVELRTR